MITRIIKIAALSLFVSAFAQAQENEIFYLSGRDKDHTVNWEFQCSSGRNSGFWSTIPVPSCWELQGFGTYNYGRDRQAGNEVGLYRHRFMVPLSWKRRHVDLVFEGVMTETRVMVNGRLAGAVHCGGFYRFSYAVDSLLHFGRENLLEVRVAKQSDNASVNRAERQADYWIFGGIFRPVYLLIRPEEYIDRCAIAAAGDGTLTIDVFPGNITTTRTITAQLYTPQGRLVGAPLKTTLIPGTAKATLQTLIQNINTWSAETPYLYDVTVELASHKLLHRVREKIGFRTLAVKPGDGIYLNDRKILLKGVNRHCFWPESGRTLSRDISLQDALLIKEMNMNSVRMSHYPPDSHFLDICDSLGLYVLDELAGWQSAYDTDIGRTLVKELVTRDVNHPCVLFWDNGNEGGFNYSLEDEFYRWDPQKRVVLHPWETSNGINTAHYQPYETNRRFAQGPDLLMPTELLHGLYDGGLGAGLQDFWDLTRTQPCVSGAFLWALLDEAVVRTDDNHRLDTAGNQAPDGILGPHREKEGSFFTIKEIFAPLHIDFINGNERFQGKIKVENRYDFTDLASGRLRLELVDFPSPFDTSMAWISYRHEMPLPSIPPHTSRDIALPLPEFFQSHDALRIIFIDGSGRMVLAKTISFKEANEYVQAMVHRGMGSIQIEEGESTITVTAGKTEFRFSRHGKLSRVLCSGREISFNNGPSLATGNTRNARTLCKVTEDACTIETTFNAGAFRSLRWTVYPGGWLRLDYQYQLFGPVDFMGISFSCPESKIRSAKWLGQGPYRVWKNRRAGGHLNIWQNRYNDTVTGQSWDYPEFKGYFGHWYWLVLETADGPVTICSATPDLYFLLYTPTSGPNPMSCLSRFPALDISFLHAIAPIGTKFLEPDNLGPMSEKTRADGDYQATLYFYFGRP